ncbi:DUF2300 domain-containing protein [Uliginosibacterium gangwonense]|uniref:DUF2300 domain-containing protein n=1 Tax=Uliginosibacterium gangwonense TaxID=392736 RepID=UPI000380EAFD|nr:DUF2300 domain-containing protein [Uliginosibacterium gangwonense]
MEYRRRISLPWRPAIRGAIGVFGLLGLVLGASAWAAPQAGNTLFATRDQGQTTLSLLDLQGMQNANGVVMPSAPLGSVWKLFVYGYLVAQRKESGDYQCHGKDREEVYCCEPGGHIGREEALQRSCGLYFEPQRLSLKTQSWQNFWRERGAPEWLQQLSRLREDTRVSVDSLLAALDAFPEEARQQSAQTLLGVLTRPNAGGAIEAYGGLLRGKTWTMPDPQHPGMHLGGAAGWLADGRPFWLGGTGAGIEVLRKAAPALQDYLTQMHVPDDASCVEVRFFDRYPLSAVLSMPGREPAKPGRLEGDFLAVFTKGTSLPFSAHGELRLVREQGAWVVRGRLGLNDYVARVVEREGSSQPQAAAQALAVAARSYLVQQAERRAGCYVIRDSSATQRVGPRPPGRAARQIADWSTDLVLRGAPVRYHTDRDAPGILSWRRAREQAEQGLGFERILAQAFPAASLGGIASRQENDCVVATQAQRWLKDNVPRWRNRLEREEGYVEPETLPTICLTGAERPFADTDRHRLHVRGWASQEDRIALAHEYLHLAFEGHPRAYDEVLVERLARQLIMEVH